jgi:hypothetical protein
MRKNPAVIVCFCLIGIILPGAPRAQEAPKTSAGPHPEEAMVDGLLSEWCIQATKQSGPLATWELLNDATGPGGESLLALTKPNHDNEDTINLLWNRRGGFLNGGIEFKLKAQGGQKARGGGVVWRMMDKNNYYMAFADTNAGAVNLYCVKNGTPASLARAPFDAPGQEWITLRMETWGEQIAVGINGRKVIDVKDDTLRRPGGIGYCTRADAATAFTPIKLDF